MAGIFDALGSVFGAVCDTAQAAGKAARALNEACDELQLAARPGTRAMCIVALASLHTAKQQALHETRTTEAELYAVSTTTAANPQQQ